MKKFGQDHIVFLGDTLKILEQEIENQSIHLIFADPPYNIGKKYVNTTDKWSDKDIFLN
ncbi:hypothetical protein PN462_09495 [Spirulina sp. CS-785/01]|nr:hypothetical protein [Spirulina sp. CS-785/01]MDB9313332.1 hypothetical protein [Spirulina sp. CS-785/01]